MMKITTDEMIVYRGSPWDIRGRFCGDQVSFQWKNPDFLLRNPDFLLRNPDFLLRNPDFLLKNDDFILKKRSAYRSVAQTTRLW